MKLSEAIRVGAKIHPQGTGDFRTYNVKRRWWHTFFGKSVEEVKTCALGAAIEAQGCDFKLGKGSGLPFRGKPAPEGATFYYLDSPSEWPLSYYHDCPQCQFTSPDSDRPMLAQLIPHLNDEHKWTREQIALLVERFEKTIVPKDETDPTMLEMIERLWKQRQQVEALRIESEQNLRREEELRQQAEWPEEIG